MNFPELSAYIIKHVPLAEKIRSTVITRKYDNIYIAWCISCQMTMDNSYLRDGFPGMWCKAKGKKFHCSYCGITGDVIDFTRIHYEYNIKDTLNHLIGEFKLPITLDS